MIPRQALISDRYAALQRELHARPQGYGGKGRKWVHTVRWLATYFDASSVLDYGCGEGSLAKALEGSGLAVREYDPAIAGKDGPPSFADLVVCTDVLEHIEPDRLDVVIGHLRALARRAVFLVVNLRESNKTMLDGRNAHLIIETAEWWQARIQTNGLTVHQLPGMPIAASLNAEKRQKCWIAAVTP